MHFPGDTYKNVIAAQSGDEVAWNSLFQQHYPWMYATALHLCDNNSAAKDAVQETFMNAFLKLHQLQDTHAFAGWLKTSLIRYCRRSRDGHLLVAAEGFSPAESTCLWNDEISEKLDRYEQQTRVYKALSCLPDILQTVLLLRYFSASHSYGQIAAVLCIPVGTVRSRLSQAKQKMMVHWLETGPENDKAFRRALEWNDLYTTYFGNLYTSLHYREKLIGHFDKDLHLLFTSGKTVFGRKMVEQQIEEDILHGNSFLGLHVVSSGDTSIVEVHNSNSPEYLNRCPDSTVFVLHRTGARVTRLRLHHST